MELVEKLNQELYNTFYDNNDYERFEMGKYGGLNVFYYKEELEKSQRNVDEVWNEIKNNEEVLTEAVEVIQNESKKNTVKGIYICDHMLVYHEDINPEIYKKLINRIFKDEDISSIYLSGDTFLVKAFSNKNLQLTKEQKEFTIRQLNDLNNVYGGPYDLKYQILRNNSWSKEEKIELLKELYDSSTFKKMIDEWENQVAFDINNLNFFRLQIKKDDIYINYILKTLNSICRKDSFLSVKIKEIIDEINFCGAMRELYNIVYNKGKQKVK